MEIKIFTTIEQNIINDWMSLWQRSHLANYTNSPLWFLALLESFHYTNYRIIAIYKEKQLIALSALVKKRKYGLSFSTLPLSDYICGNPFLLDLRDEKVVSLMIKEWLNLGNILFINIPVDTVTALQQQTISFDAIPEAYHFTLALSRDIDGNPIIPNRKKLMHKVRDYEDQVTLKSYDGTETKALELAFAIDAKSRKNTRGYSSFADKTIQNMYRSLARNFKERMRINILSYGKKQIAYEIGFQIGTTYYGSQLAFHETYANIAPEKIMYVKLFEYLAAKGIQYIDFGSGDSHLKRAVTHDYDLLYQIIISNNHLVRQYITLIRTIRVTLFHKLQKYNHIYAWYKKAKKGVSA
jgi:hypothetical protein